MRALTMVAGTIALMIAGSCALAVAAIAVHDAVHERRKRLEALEAHLQLLTWGGREILKKEKRGRRHQYAGDEWERRA